MSRQVDRRRQSPVARLYMWACERLYNELAWTYDPVSWLVSAGQWSRWRLEALQVLEQHWAGEALPTSTSRRVLEVGFGTGRLLVEMAARGLDVYGLERSPAMQRVTAARARRRGLRHLPTVCAPVQTTPFRACAFDAVLSTFPAGFIFDPRALCEFGRVLKTRGLLVVAGLGVGINRPALRRLIPVFYGLPGEQVMRHWKQMTVEAGLEVTVEDHELGWATLPIIVARKVSSLCP